MRKKVLIIKNIAREGPGIIGNLLKERNINYTVIDLDKGETFPSPKDYSAIVSWAGRTAPMITLRKWSPNYKGSKKPFP